MDVSQSFVPENRMAPRLCVAWMAAFWVVSGCLSCWGVVLTGSNGTTVDFAGVKRATPEGLEVQVSAEGTLLVVPWSRFDLTKMETEAPVVFEAYGKSRNGEVVELNLGIFAPAPAPDEKMEAPKKSEPPPPPTKPAQPVSEYSAEVELTGKGGESGVTGIRGVALLPPGGEAKGILLLAAGDEASFIRYAPTTWGGLWGNFQKEVPVAIVACDIVSDHGKSLLGVDPGLVHPERGSGELILGVITKLGQQLKKDDWDKLPILVHGHGVLGGGLAFNLAQWSPERIAGVVAGRGAFYATPVTDASLKVPVLFIKGGSDRTQETWNATQTQDETYEAHVSRVPNWVWSIEPNGDNREGPISYRLAQDFLLEIWRARKPGEDGTMPEMNRSAGWLGDLRTGEVSRLSDPTVPLSALQTWLPSARFAALWKQFVLGGLPPGEPGEAAKP